MSKEPDAPILVLDGIRRGFSQGNARLEVLQGASLAVRRGELVALIGPSGSGKSTLLHIAGLLEQPDDGAVIIAGQAAGKLADIRRTEIRRKTDKPPASFRLSDNTRSSRNPSVITAVDEDEDRERGP